MLSPAVQVSVVAASILSPVQVEVLKPSEKWVVDYRVDQCLASRRYGNPEKPIVLGVRPALNGESYELLVAQPREGPEFAKELKGAVDFGRGPIKAWLLSYGAKNSKSSLYQFRIPAAAIAQAKSAATVTFIIGSGSSLSFSLSAMGALLETLEDCTANLQKYWNAGSDKVGSAATPPKGGLRGLFTANDYPADALDRDQEGSSQFLLLIDEKGAVAGCDVLKPSGIPILDVMGCQVIRERAKFSPARDPSGAPIRSTITTPPVVWRMEG